MRSDAIDPTVLSSGLPLPGLGTRRDWELVGAPRRMFSDGRLIQVVRGLYCLPADEPAPRELIEALRPVLPSDSALSGWASALLQDVRDAGPTMCSTTPQPVQVVLARDRHLRIPGCVPLRVDLAPDDIEIVHGLRVTTPRRTAYDMSRFSGHDELALVILECFLSELNPRPVSVGEVLELVRSRPGSRGNPRVCRMLEIASQRTRSPAETRLRRTIISDLGVDPSMLLVNASLMVDGVTVAEFDLVDRTSGQVFEYDGDQHSDAVQRGRDARKDRLVADLGLGMMRMNKLDVRRDHSVLVREMTVRRDAAIRAGGAAIVQRLVSDGQLIEQPLKSYNH